MMHIGIRAMLSALVLLAAWPAQAQDRTWGVLLAYPGSIGLQWDVSSKFAFRVDGDFVRNETSITTGMADPPSRSIPGFGAIPPIFIASITELTTTAGSIAVSGVFALHSREELTIYVAPRVGVQILNLSTRTEWDVSGIPPALLAALSLPANEERSDTDYAPDISAIFGASYRLGDRFGVFGETGFGYTRGTSETTTGISEVERSTFGLRAGIGGILYF